jgi:hypothetical protein
MSWLLRNITLVTAVLASGLAFSAPSKDATQYGAGLIVNVPFSEHEVEQVIQDVVQNGIIRGTKEYNKDEYMTGAEAATSTRVFPQWTEGGKVFFKVRLKALDPWNFKDTNDTGTVAVRYVVQAQDDKHTVVRIDARFVDDSRHAGHPSNGSVESSEYKTIHDRLESIALMKTEAADQQQKKQDSSSKNQQVALRNEPAMAPPVAELPKPAEDRPQPTPASLEERVHSLRQQVERVVIAPGAALKSAPFHTASTLQSLASGSEVLVEISTPYWLGVETHGGQHGWMLREQLEPLP